MTAPHGVRAHAPQHIHPPKVELFDLDAMTNTDPKGIVRTVREYRVEPFGLYVARDVVDHPTIRALESWLLPEMGLRITDWFYPPGHEWDDHLYVDVVRIDVDGRCWRTEDHYLDLVVRTGTASRCSIPMSCWTRSPPACSIDLLRRRRWSRRIGRWMAWPGTVTGWTVGCRRWACGRPGAGTEPIAGSQTTSQPVRSAHCSARSSALERNGVFAVASASMLSGCCAARRCLSSAYSVHPPDEPAANPAVTRLPARSGSRPAGCGS